ncbi:hypothetical protein K432DRAFT_377746 [Lepidopterella palustris CBS 459.81]|uniref:Zn(2)-C6 fungal-type domain-containing protein n=1 Tax=Lepidopterella palustris CBS 459.81 TaxID=1314670 RepID=A0A8E2JK34_9PEZI|nr:hypothetical protein K432DRAFT_377746 [Lepidopterella palustris CBS 459.81]
MSYRGRPSKGCQMCRSRKVKCDETKPTCKRCAKADHECKYRDDADLYFRNETAVAAQRAEEGWRKRSTKQLKSSQSSQSPPSDSDSLSTTNPNAQHRTLSREIKPDLHQLAWQRFCFDFVIPNLSTDARSVATGVLEFLPSMYEKCSPESPLWAAVAAVSYANFDGRFKSPEARLLGSEFCGRALRLIQTAIGDPLQARSDETLLSVYLLGIWENLTAPEYNGSWIAHKSGSVALLRLREPYMSSTTISARLFDLVYIQMLIGNFQSNEEPPLSLETWVDMVHTANPGNPNLLAPVIRLMKLIHSAVSTLAQRKRMIPFIGNSNGTIAAVELLKESRALDSQFQLWEDNVPETWRFRVLQNHPSLHGTFDPKWVKLILDHEGAPSFVHMYPTLKKAFAWNFYRTARLFLNRVMYELIDGLASSPCSDTVWASSVELLDRTHIEFQLARLTEEICASVISHFTVNIANKPNSNSVDDVCAMRGYTLIWPLAVVKTLRAGMINGIEPISRRKWIDNILEFLRDELGIAKAGAAIRAKFH